MAGIGIALLLMALTGGMFLLAKTNKDNLGAFYRVVAWAVIVISMLCMLCCACCCMMRRHCMMNGGGCGNEMMMQRGCEMEENCGGGKCVSPIQKQMMIRMQCQGMEQGCRMHSSCEKEMGCEGEAAGECCKGKKEDCCKMKGEGACIDKVEKKDSVVVKK